MRHVVEAAGTPDAADGERDDARVVPFDRLRRRDREAAKLLGLVSAARGVPWLLLLHRSRCTADVAEARQLAMYLMHVALRRNYAEVGRIFGRDRTTVSYACAHIEDLRDRPEIEAEVSRLEAALSPPAAAEAERMRHAAR